MFHTTINLLSPQKKSRLKKVVKFLFVKEMLELSIFTCVLLAITHLLAGFVLTQTLNDLAGSSLLINREFPSINNDIRAVNSLVKNINDSAEGYSPLAPKFIQLLDSIPDNIRLDAVTLGREDLTLSLSGNAQTREALLHFQTVLRDIPWIQEVSTPVSQLFQKDNIPFQIQTTIKDISRARGTKLPGAKSRSTIDE